MCQLVHPGKTWALDLDAKLLAEAEHACRGNPILIAVLADAMQLSRYISAPVDFVFIANTFHGVPDKAALSMAVYAALKHAGRFAIVDWHRLRRDETRVLGEPWGRIRRCGWSPMMSERWLSLPGSRSKRSSKWGRITTRPYS